MNNNIKYQFIRLDDIKDDLNTKTMRKIVLYCHFLQHYYKPVKGFDFSYFFKFEKKLIFDILISIEYKYNTDKICVFQLFNNQILISN
jgi:hypothetical protein